MAILSACSGRAAVPVAAPPGAAPATAPSATSARQAASRASSSAPPTAVPRVPSAATSVLTQTSPAALTTALAAALFTSDPVVVVTAAAGPSLPQAEADASAAHAPVLLASQGTAQAIGGLTASVRALHPVAVLAIGLPAAWRGALAAGLPGVRVATRPAALPATGTPVPQGHVAVLVPAGSSGDTPGSVPLSAVTATARAAGATVIDIAGDDPRADPAAITALAQLHPAAVIAVGAQFGTPARLASRVEAAETGRQLPGGGQVLFPGRRLVALYGHPGTPSLGVLGQQDLAASLARAKKTAASYGPLSKVPVVPAFEIIASVAEASPGPDGTYSYETPVSQLLPWVKQATADGLYVVLDLQPGRANLLAQAEHYQALLEMPDVGLALDAEWKLQPGQQPLQQIGHVDISEVNSVVSWLAGLTDRYHLPQKLLVLHQFRLSMLSGEQQLDTSHDDLAIVIHMDGQGTPSMKQATWNAVTAAAPRGVYFGWKNFLVKDHPMLTPQQTMREQPTPVMISYQ